MIELTRQQIAAAALELEGIPFSHHGRDPEDGLDCAGVLVATFAKFGIRLQEKPLDYPRLPPEEHVRQCLEINFDLVLVRGPEFGDIAHIKFNRDKEARHLGVIVPGSRETMIIHALRSRRRVVLEPLRGLLTESSIVDLYQWPRLQS